MMQMEWRSFLASLAARLAAASESLPANHHITRALSAGLPACHRILKQTGYRRWICVDLDRTRNGPLASYQRCGRYITSRLEPIYV